jgi:hypothetical protein
MQGPNHSHLEQGAARPLPLSSAACREASLRRSWPQQRVVQVIVAPKLGSGESMPDRAGVGAMLGKAHLGDRSHTPIRQYQIWAFAADPPSHDARRAIVAVCQGPYPSLRPQAIGCLKVASATGRTGIKGMVIAIRVRVYPKACSVVLPTKAC